MLPYENTIYLADSVNAPYGLKSKEQIIELCVKNSELLIQKGCKIVVVACNTATTNAIDFLRKNYKLPFIGIEPAIKPAALNTKTNAIGILATKGTLSSSLFNQTSGQFATDVNVIEQHGDGIVELIESGLLESDAMRDLLNRYMEPMLNAQIDYLVLGCTHYPYLIPLLLDILPPSVKIIDSGEAVARQTKAVLQQHNLLNNKTSNPKLEFFTNGSTRVLQALVGDFSDPKYLSF